MCGASVVVAVLALLHVFIGTVSVFIGVAASIQADQWPAYLVAPVWSGVFFIATGILGILCAKRKTSFMIMGFTILAIISLVTCMVSLQLLRLSLVQDATDEANHHHTHAFVLAAIAVAVLEILTCLVSSVVSCRLAKEAKKQLIQEGKHVKDNEAFPTDVIDEGDIEMAVASDHVGSHHHTLREDANFGHVDGAVSLGQQGDANDANCMYWSNNQADTVDIEYLTELDSSGRLPDIDVPKMRRVVNLLHKNDSCDVISSQPTVNIASGM